MTFRATPSLFFGAMPQNLKGVAHINKQVLRWGIAATAHQTAEPKHVTSPVLAVAVN